MAKKGKAPKKAQAKVAMAKKTKPAKREVTIVTVLGLVKKFGKEPFTATDLAQSDTPKRVGKDWQAVLDALKAHPEAFERVGAWGWQLCAPTEANEKVV